MYYYYIVNTMKQYCLVLDFEANCSKKDTNDHQIIEWPCVLIDTVKREIVSEFRELILPLNRRPISPFIEELTSLTSAIIYKNGIEWHEALSRFEKWRDSLNLTINNCTVVCCGNWDLRTMLPKQLRMSSTLLSPKSHTLLSEWHNIKLSFMKEYGLKTQEDLVGMLRVLGVPLEGHHHLGIHDCRNIAKIVFALLNDGVDVTATNQTNIC